MNRLLSVWQRGPNVALRRLAHVSGQHGERLTPLDPWTHMVITSDELADNDECR